jgi:hypothetical protein
MSIAQPIIDPVRDSHPAIISGATECSPRLWPPRPTPFPELMTAIEAAQYLRLDEFGSHNPVSATRTLKFWRDKGELKATKFARRVWYRKAELDRFLAVKTET